MREVLYSKLVFLDSHDGVKGKRSLKPTFHVPTNAFSCGQDESMRMVLKSFTMPKSFYNINQTNNTFFYRKTGTNTDIQVSLTPGDYTATELAQEVQDRVRATPGLGGTSFTCVYEATTKKLKLTIPSNYTTGYFVSYFDKTNTISASSTDNHTHYSDAHEVLGGTPSTTDAPVQLFDGEVHSSGSGNTIVLSKYPIRLSTIENIFLRCSAQGDAFCSTTYEPFKTGNKLDTTDIWASIPNVTNANNNIVLYDNSEDYQIHMKQHQLSTLKFSVSDGKGRELPLVGVDQAKDGNINFTLVFRFEIMREPHETYIVGEPTAVYRQPPQMTS